MLENNEQPTSLSKYDRYRQQFKIYNRRYRETHQEKIKEIRQSENYKKAKEQFIERNPNYFSEYYTKNKDKLLERLKQQQTYCNACEKYISTSHLKAHNQRPKHINNLSKLSSDSCNSSSESN